MQLLPPSRKNPPYVALALGSVLLAGLGTVACGAPEDAPDDFGAADPIDQNVEVEVIAGGQSPFGVAWRGAAPSLIADGSGVYWYDADGNVFARHRGDAEVVELLAGVESVFESVAAQGPTPVVMSLVAGVDHLYAGEADAVDAIETLGRMPPSRLLSIPKQGGPATVLLESESELLTPIAVDGNRLLVTGHGDNATLRHYQVDLANPALVPLPPEPAYGPVAISGGVFYWTDTDVLSEQPVRVENYSFSVCPGYFMAHHLGQLDTLFLADAAGHERPFSRIGVAIGDPLCDPRHVYFYSFGGSGPLVAEQQLVRVDVETGQLARLVSPDLSLQYYVSILGDDDENVYVENGDSLLAIRKP